MRYVRKSGVLLHPSSLPGLGGIGTLGGEARRFVDFLASARQTVWQVLPLGPTGYGNSPYSCYSAFAGNPLLIDLQLLVDEGDLTPGELKSILPEEWVDFHALVREKPVLLKKAAGRFLADDDRSRLVEFWHFCDTTFWLHDYALFKALKEHFHGKSWNEWPQDIAQRTPAALERYSVELGASIGEQKYMQWQFSRQWRKVKEYANSRGVEVVGDMPIFVAYDSADVWCNQHLFHLDEHRRPTVIAGVPPDYFSKTGQLWGNPLYNWERMAEHGYSWWIARVRNDLTLYDRVRIDHFRGFEAYWEVPAGEKTAVNGKWVKGPGEDLFNVLHNSIGELRIIAEDLGVITPEVEALRDWYGFPGMKILQFAFGSGADNPYLPHNHIRECVVYTGTHDNDTTAGWFASLPLRERKEVLRYLGTSGEEIAWEMIRVAMASVAALAIIPLQDILTLGNEGRMNRPGTVGSNWGWRFQSDALSEEVVERLRHLTELYGRTGKHV